MTSDVIPPPPGLSESSPGPEVALLFIGVSLALGAACRQLLQNTRIPYTVALLMIGVALGALEYKESVHLGKLGQSIKMWANINPDLILYVFLPGLLFESSFAFEFHQIKRCILQMFLLAGPGVAISTILLGLVNKFILPYSWNWSTSLLLGGLLSATDPVAVVALLKDLGASKKLSTIIDGEALMNDGTAIVVFQLFYKIVLGENSSAGEIITFLIKVTVGAIALGLAFGLVGVAWLQTVFNDYVIEITLTFTVSYMGFFVANGVTNMSGVLTVMTLGIIFAVFAKTALTGESETSMHHFWEMITYIANTLIFILSGVVIAESILHSSGTIQGSDWGYLIVLYLFVQLSRAAVVLILYPGLAVSGYGLDWKEAIVLIWSGLRGAVALSLALIVNHKKSIHILSLTNDRIVFLTGGVVFLTLIINGTTTQFLLAALKMNKSSETKKRILDFTRFEMYDRAVKAFEDMGIDDSELGNADWLTVKKYVRFLNIPASSIHPQNGDADKESLLRQASHHDLRIQQIQDVRLRFLNGVQAAYWSMLEEGRITQTVALLLMQGVAEAIDVATKSHRLDVWSGLKPHVNLPFYLKFLRSYAPWLPESFFSWILVGRLELGASIAAAFLRAQRHARSRLKGFMGENEVANMIMKESVAEEKEAEQFLEDIRLSFPEVLHVIKTKQVAYAILLQLQQYVDSLSHAGLLDQKESIHLQEAVQKDMKLLIRRPPLVNEPTPGEILVLQPLVAGIPADLRDRLTAGARRHTKLKGSTLVSKGSSADGIWLVVTGILQWDAWNGEEGEECREIAHSGCVGLYEVLTGKPYLTTVQSSSVVNCFFLDRSRVLAAFTSDVQVAMFMWKEAALLVSKMVLGDVLKHLKLHDLRQLLQQEDSVIQECAAGSEVQVKEGQVAVLLEGSVTPAGSVEAPLEAPQGLCFTPGNGAESESSAFICQCVCRVLFFRLPTPEAAHDEDSVHTHSLTFSRANSLARHSSHDHDGLLRWTAMEEKRHKQKVEEEDRNLASKSALMRMSSGGLSMAEASWGTLTLPEDIDHSRRSHHGHASHKSTVHSRSHHSLPQDSQTDGDQIRNFEERRKSLFKSDSHGHLLEAKYGKKSHVVSFLSGNQTSSRHAADDDDLEHVVAIESPSHLFP